MSLKPWSKFLRGRDDNTEKWAENTIIHLSPGCPECCLGLISKGHVMKEQAKRGENRTQTPDARSEKKLRKLSEHMITRRDSQLRFTWIVLAAQQKPRHADDWRNFRTWFGY